MKQFDFPVCIAIPHMRPLHDEHHGTKACNDADSRPTLRNGVHHMYFPALTMPKRGPKCKLGYHRIFNLILWVLYTGMQWKCLPVPPDIHGKPAIHYTTICRVFAKWADDGSLWQAFIASVAHLSAEKHLDLRVLHGDGTNTVAKKGGMVLATLGTNIRQERRSSPLPTTMAMC
jgi:transposase